MRKTSDIIKERIVTAKARFNANDNIAEFVKPGELELLQNEVQNEMQRVLSSLVIDTEHDHNTKETAKRVAKMFLNETFGGVMYQQEQQVFQYGI